MNDREAHSQRLTIAPVTRERLAAVCKQMHLTDPVAVRNLKVCLQHIEADLAGKSRTAYAPSERKDIIARRKTLLAALASFERSLDENSDLLLEVLPRGTLEEIGLLLAPETIQEVLGTHSPRYLNAADRVGTHRAAGLEYGHLLIRHFVRRVRQPIDDWMAENNENAGGRPPDIRRKYIIRQLADAAPEIIGAAATASTNSPFVQLCVAVFQAFELSDEGIEDAVERELRDLSSEGSEQTDAG